MSRDRKLVSGRARRAKRPLTEDEKARMAIDRYGPLSRGRAPMAISKIAAKYDRDAATVSRAIKDAFSEGLIEIHKVDVPLGSLARDESLENELRSAFPRLSTAIVVEGDAEDGDRVHKRLGHAMAEVIANSPLLRPGDTIGLGSGRGVYYTVKLLHGFPRAQVENITLMSLTGALFPRTHSERLNALLDADLHIALLGACFATQVSLKPMAYPIAHENVESTKTGTWLDQTQFEKHVPNHALVGVGVLEAGHRYYDAVKKGEIAPILRPIEADLRKLMTLVEQVASPDSFCLVADLGNRLFHVPALREEQISSTTQRQILSAIERINQRTLTVTWEQFQQIGNLMLIAGTRRKGLAIRTLLKRDDLSVRVLCTDVSAARVILDTSGIV